MSRLPTDLKVDLAERARFEVLLTDLSAHFVGVTGDHRADRPPFCEPPPALFGWHYPVASRFHRRELAYDLLQALTSQLPPAPVKFAYHAAWKEVCVSPCQRTGYAEIEK